MKTILVTGGAGFIGSHLCERLLKEGYKVVNLDNFNSYYDPAIKEKNILEALEHEHYKLYRGDILDRPLLEKIYSENRVEGIIHLAAMAGVRNSLSDPLEYVDVDIKGTVNMLQFAKDHGIDKFVFASSSSVYGVNEKAPFAESDPVELQVSPYATAKRAGELYCHTYSHLYHMDISCLRFFTVYGPRQRPEMAIHNFTQKIINGEPITVFGDGHSQRDYTYIEDIIDGIFSAFVNLKGFEIYNLGNSDTIALKDLIAVIEETCEKKAIIDRQSDQKGDVPLTYASIEKSKFRLGYEPKVKIKQGINKFYQWKMSV